MQYRTANRNDDVFTLQHTIFSGPYAYDKDFIDKLINENRIIIALNGKGMCGFIMFMVTKHELSGKKVNTIISIGVKSEVRGRGIGKNLVRLVLNIMKDVYLHVRTDNLIAISLYKSLDFKVIATIRNYYLDCDAYYCAHE